MAQKKQRTINPETDDKPQVPTTNLRMAPIIMANEEEDIPVPEIMKTMEEEGFEVAPSNLFPTVQWERPGDWIIGTYLNTKEEVGPNHSRLYNFQLTDPAGGKPIFAAIWGSTALNATFDAIAPRPGNMIFIQYVGEQPTQRGQNPVKTFRVAIKRMGRSD